MYLCTELLPTSVYLEYTCSFTICVLQPYTQMVVMNLIYSIPHLHIYTQWVFFSANISPKLPDFVNLILFRVSDIKLNGIRIVKEHHNTYLFQCVSFRLHACAQKHGNSKRHRRPVI